MTEVIHMGDGSGGAGVHHEDMAGWVRFFADSLEPTPEELSDWLAQAMAEWFRQRPQLRLRTAAPITMQGNTVELYVWYDFPVSPDLAGRHAEPQE